MNNLMQMFGNMQNMANQFDQFRQNFNNPNPQQYVQQLLDSGRMTQEQYNYFSQMASQAQHMLMKLLNDLNRR